MKRRQFIVGLGGAVAWPVVARAQQPERMRRIGLLHVYDENDPEGKRRVSAFTQALSGLGWTDGRNVRMEIRWGGNDSNRIRTLAQELVGLQPDVIVTAPAVGSTARAGTSPASPSSKPRWEASGLSCSRRSRRGSSGQQSCSIPICQPHRLICRHLRPWLSHSRFCQSIRPFIVT